MQRRSRAVDFAESEKPPRRLSSILDEADVAEALEAYENKSVASKQAGPPAAPQQGAAAVAARSRPAFDIRGRIWRARFAIITAVIAPLSLYWTNFVTMEFENIFSTILALLLLYDLIRDMFQQSKLFESARACHLSAMCFVAVFVAGWAVFAHENGHDHQHDSKGWWWNFTKRFSSSGSTAAVVIPRWEILYNELHSLNFAIVIISTVLVVVRVLTIDLVVTPAAAISSTDKEKLN